MCASLWMSCMLECLWHVGRNPAVCCAYIETACIFPQIHTLAALTGTIHRMVINQYLSLISRRGAGELQTAAAWMRAFVRSHPEYKQGEVLLRSLSHLPQAVIPLRCNSFLISVYNNPLPIFALVVPPYPQPHSLFLQYLFCLFRLRSW